MSLQSRTPQPRGAVAVVTGGSTRAGREVARGLAGWGWPVVVVYDDHQSRAEATISEIIAAGGTTVAVRADLTDELDVQRLFSESISAFGDVDVVVHTTADDASVLWEQAARQLRRGGALVSTTAAAPTPPEVASILRTQGISDWRVALEEVLAVLDGWRRQSTG